MNDRTRFLGSSDMAALLGIAPLSWEISTPLDLYLSKIGELKKEDKPVLRRGKRWEQPALEMLMDKIEDEDGRRPKVIYHNQRYIDTKYDFLSCEIDAEFILGGERVNVEIKTVNVRKAWEWGEEGTSEIPLHYAAQTMFGLGITGRDRCIVAPLFGADEIEKFEVVRDNETIKGMREKAVDFWMNHVLERVPPEPVNMSDMMKLFKKFIGKPVELDDTHFCMLSGRKARQEQIKQLEKQNDEIEFQICDFIRRQWNLSPAELSKTLEDSIRNASVDVPEDATLLHEGKIAGTWKKQRGENLDWERLKKERPEILEEYKKEHWFRVLRKKGKS